MKSSTKKTAESKQEVEAKKKKTGKKALKVATLESVVNVVGGGCSYGAGGCSMGSHGGWSNMM